MFGIGLEVAVMIVVLAAISNFLVYDYFRNRDEHPLWRAIAIPAFLLALLFFSRGELAWYAGALASVYILTLVVAGYRGNTSFDRRLAREVSEFNKRLQERPEESVNIRHWPITK